MQAVVPTSVHLASHYILSYKQCPSTNLEKKKKIMCVPYSSDVGSIMYTISVLGLM